MLDAKKSEIMFKNIKNDYLVDMETFDFLRICKQNNLKVVGAIRVVSDILTGKNEKWKRLLCNFKFGCELLIKIILSKVNYYTELPYQFEKLAISEIILSFQKDKINFPHRINNTIIIINPLFTEEIKNKNEQNIKNLLNRYLKDEELIKIKEFKNNDDFNEWQNLKIKYEKEIGNYLEEKMEFVIKFDNKLLDNYNDLFKKYQNDIKKIKNKKLFDTFSDLNIPNNVYGKSVQSNLPPSYTPPSNLPYGLYDPIEYE